MSRFHLKDVRRIDFGIQSKRMLKNKKRLKNQEHLCLSIVTDKDHVLDLIIEDGDLFKIWVTGLQLFINDCYLEAENLGVARHQFYLNLWAEVDLNLDKRLDEGEIKILLNKMNIDMTNDYFKILFDKYDEDKNGVIDLQEFVKMMDSMKQREELNELFDKLKNP